MWNRAFVAGVREAFLDGVWSHLPTSHCAPPRSRGVSQPAPGPAFRLRVEHWPLNTLKVLR
ncbi:MAG: hypothetical protein KKA73_08910 [Chloroflexi bacterium]|nr:hypothetical protein [Chloroflexota bacterium]MBU1747797.1 hypothetical protein [Chloroflexota bacterium]